MTPPKLFRSGGVNCLCFKAIYVKSSRKGRKELLLSIFQTVMLDREDLSDHRCHTHKRPLFLKGGSGVYYNSGV